VPPRGTDRDRKTGIIPGEGAGPNKPAPEPESSKFIIRWFVVGPAPLRGRIGAGKPAYSRRERRSYLYQSVGTGSRNGRSYKFEIKF